MPEHIINQIASSTTLSRRESLGIGATSAILASCQKNRLDVEPHQLHFGVERVINLSQYGYVGDGKHDDTPAWRAAISAAAQANIRLIIIPWGVNGVSLVKQSICHGPLPSGLTFEAETRRHANPDQDGQRVVYTGADVCWSITTGNGGPATVGQWTWRHLMFEATNPTASMFDFNATATGTAQDGTGASYIMFVAFESCYLKGGGGGRSQTGDAIRATKTFSLHIDKQSQIRNWRRGVWLRGCDDCTIDGRLWLNARSVMHERSGTFGSNLQIGANWLGRCPDETVEPGYILWDNGSGTAVNGTFFEGHDHGATRQNEQALVRLAGFATTLMGCRFAEGKCLEFAPGAREITLVAPGFAAHRPENNAIISEPESWDFGFQQEDFRILVLGASKNAIKHLGAHPRLVYRSRMPMAYDAIGGVVPVDMEADIVADDNGYRPRRRLLTAFSYFAKNDSTIVNGGAHMVANTAASQGWVIACQADRPQAGINCAFLIGRDFQLGDRLRIAIRSSCPSQGWQLHVFRGNADVSSTPLALGGSAALRWQAMTIDLDDWRPGDRLSVTVLKMTQPAHDLIIDFVEIATVARVDTTPLPKSPVQLGHGDDIASVRSVNAAIDTLAAQIAALQAALSRSGV
jgi:hypothetical protein